MGGLADRDGRQLRSDEGSARGRNPIVNTTGDRMNGPIGFHGGKSEGEEV